VYINQSQRVIFFLVLCALDLENEWKLRFITSQFQSLAVSLSDIAETYFHVVYLQHEALKGLRGITIYYIKRRLLNTAGQ